MTIPVRHYVSQLLDFICLGVQQIMTSFGPRDPVVDAEPVVMQQLDATNTQAS